MPGSLVPSLDLRLFRIVNVDGGPWLDALAVAFAPAATGIAYGLLLAVLILAGSRRPGAERVRLVVALALGVALADLLGAEVVKPLVGRVRPNHALPDVRQLAPGANVGSLPSLHAANYAALAAVAWAAARWLGVLACAVALAAAWSRVYVGVHWPADVLVGAAWGAGWGLAALELTRRALRAFARRRCG